MMRLALALCTAALVLTACSGEPDLVATDPSPTPTATPTTGTYPSYAARDYAFTLRVSCFCPDPGPVRVTVSDGAVVSATYLGGGGGKGSSDVAPGEEADEAHRLSIDDVIEAANDTDAAHVEVDWPRDQDHPSSVWVDRDLQVADEEVGYTVSDVVPAPR